nr:MAG TPA: hypothetical protein [Caudoviricetes sp.]
MNKKSGLIIGALAGLAGYLVGGKVTDYVSGKIFGNKLEEKKKLVDENGFVIIKEDWVKEDGDSTDSSSNDGDL